MRRLLLGAFILALFAAVVYGTVSVNGPQSQLIVNSSAEINSTFITNVTQIHANFSNLTGSAINSSNVTCAVNINLTTGIIDSPLTFVGDFYEINLSINQTGEIFANVTCIGHNYSADNLSVLLPFFINNSPPSAPQLLNVSPLDDYAFNLTCGQADDLENQSLFYDLFFNNSGTVTYIDRNLTNNESYIWNITTLLGASIDSQNTFIGCQAFDNNSYSNQFIKQNVALSRRPALASTFLFSFWEDNSTLFNISSIFTDPDGDEINYTVSSDDNLTIVVDNATGIINITTIHDYFGNTTITITAIDDFGYNVTSPELNVSVIDTPDVVLLYPLNGTNETVANGVYSFGAFINNTLNTVNCSLLIDDSIAFGDAETNITNLTIITDDDDARNGASAKVDESGISKTLFITGNITQLNFVMLMSDDSSEDPYLEVRVNEGTAKEKLYNITKGDIYSQEDDDDTWFTYELKVSDDDFFYGEDNNISFNSSVAALFDFIQLGTDTTTPLGRSFDGGSLQGLEYMVRAVNQTNRATFNVTVGKGTHDWNVLCYNDLGTFAKAEKDRIITVANSQPTTPTSLLPTSGVFDSEINLSCQGSTDADGDNLTYTFEYKSTPLSAEFITIVENHSSENYTWNISSLSTNITIDALQCYSNDGEIDSPSRQNLAANVVIFHPGAPTQPTNIFCDFVNCSSVNITKDVINISCNGTIDTDSTFDYHFRASYVDVNGKETFDIGTVAGLNSTDMGNLTINVSNITAQADVELSCYADDGSNPSSLTRNVTNVNITHAGAPGIPTTLTPTSGTVDETFAVTCSGSSGAYEIYAFYDDTWNLINNSHNPANTYNFNTSSILEQDLDFQCRAFDSGYYSGFLNPAGTVLIQKPPTRPDNATPLSGNFEYELSYNCNGAENGNFFTQRVEMQFDNGSGVKWYNLTTSLPGVHPVNDSDMRYEDGVYNSITSTIGIVENDRTFNVNISGGNYTYCINANGTTSSQFRLGWNCTGATCPSSNYFPSSNSFQSLSTSPATYCTNITIDQNGSTNFLITTDSSTDTIISTSIDHAYLQPLDFTFNVTNVTRQDGVLLRCLAHDESGASSYSSVSNISINRVPQFNDSKTTSFSGQGQASGTVDLNDYFYDDDNDTFNYTVASTGGASVTLSSPNVTMSSSSVGSYTIIIQADDNISQTNGSFTVSVSSSGNNGPGGGGGGGGGGAGFGTLGDTAIAENVGNQGAAGGDGGGSETTPANQGEGGGSESQEVSVEVSGDFTFTRTVEILRGGRTLVTEQVSTRNAVLGNDIVIRLSVPKEIAATADDIEITSDIEYEIVDYDPVLDFLMGSFYSLQSKSIQYILPGAYSKEDLASVTLEVIEREPVKNETPTIERASVAVKEPVIEEETYTRELVVTVEDTQIATGSKAIVQVDACVFDETTPTLQDAMVAGLIVCNEPIDFISSSRGEWTKSWRTGVDTLTCVYDIRDDRCGNNTDIIQYTYDQSASISKEIDYTRLLHFELWLMLPTLALLFLLMFPPNPARAKTKTVRFISSIGARADAILLAGLFVLHMFAFFGMISSDVRFIKNVVSVGLFVSLTYKAGLHTILTGKKYPAGVRTVVSGLLVLGYLSLFLPSIVDEQAFSLSEMDVFRNTLLWMLQIIPGDLETTLTTIGVLILSFVALFYMFSRFNGRGLYTVLGLGSSNALMLLARIVYVPSVLIIFYIIFEFAMRHLAWTLDSNLMILLFVGALAYWGYRTITGLDIGEGKSAITFKILGSIAKKAFHDALNDIDSFFQNTLQQFRYTRTVSFPLLIFLLLPILAAILIFLVPLVTGEGTPELYELIQNQELHKSLIELASTQVQHLFYDLPIVLLYVLNVLGIAVLSGISFGLAWHLMANQWKRRRTSNAFRVNHWIIALAVGSLPAMIFTPVLDFGVSGSSLAPGMEVTSQLIFETFSASFLGVGLSILIVLYSFVLLYRIFAHRIKQTRRQEVKDIVGILFFVVPFAFYLAYILLGIQTISTTLVFVFCGLAFAGTYLLSAIREFDSAIEMGALLLITLVVGLEAYGHVIRMVISIYTFTHFYLTGQTFATFATVLFTSLELLFLPLFFFVAFWFGFLREIVIQQELGLNAHKKFIFVPFRRLFAIGTPHNVAHMEYIADEPSVREEVYAALQDESISVEHRVGLLAEKGIPLLMIEEEVEEIKESDLRKTLHNEILREYREDITFNALSRSRDDVVRRLRRYPLTLDEIKHQIVLASLPESVKNGLLSRLAYRRVLSEAHMSSKKFVVPSRKKLFGQQKKLNDVLYEGLKSGVLVSKIEKDVVSKGWSSHQYEKALRSVVHRLYKYIKHMSKKGMDPVAIRRELIRAHSYDSDLYNIAADRYFKYRIRGGGE